MEHDKKERKYQQSKPDLRHFAKSSQTLGIPWWKENCFIELFDFLADMIQLIDSLISRRQELNSTGTLLRSSSWKRYWLGYESSYRTRTAYRRSGRMKRPWGSCSSFPIEEHQSFINPSCTPITSVSTIGTSCWWENHVDFRTLHSIRLTSPVETQMRRWMECLIK